jgi:hypothetical protein
VHHPDIRAREAAEAMEVEVERVEQACGRLPGDAVALEREPARPELARESTQELVAAACWRRLELVEQGEVGAATA